MLDVPLYGKIATMELFQPHVSNFHVPSVFVLVFFLKIKLIIDFVSSPQNETHDFLFIVMERYKFCVL
jgi:hypothetical protein